MEVMIVLFAGIVLLFATRLASMPARFPTMVGVVLGSWVLRIALNMFVTRSLAFFSHGVANGDCSGYEFTGIEIARIWKTEGIHFITIDSHPELNISNTALIGNLLGFIIYLVGEQCTVTCTAVVAALGLMVCLVIYRFAMYIGASEGAAFKALLLTIIGPSFVYHTSDTYKDGLNALFVVTSLYYSLRLSRKFNAVELLIMIPLLWGLWNIRPYMVFMVAVPFGVGFVGINKLSVRNVLTGLVFMVVALLAASYGFSSAFFETAQQQFDAGTSNVSQGYNAGHGGSGVSFGTGPSAIVLRILYTLFSPFPWMPGSIGLQIGKIDVLIWYYIVFAAWKSIRIMWKSDRSTVVMLMTFVIPATFVYALTMANVGLIVRQRMPIMMVVTVMATVWWTAQERQLTAQHRAEQQARLAASRAQRARMAAQSS